MWGCSIITHLSSFLFDFLCREDPEEAIDIEAFVIDCVMMSQVKAEPRDAPPVTVRAEPQEAVEAFGGGVKRKRL